MNILLINHYAGSKNHGMEYRPYYLAKEWIKYGHKVTIVAASFSHVRTVQPFIKGNITKEIIDGIQYVWLKTPEYYGNNIRRVFNMMTFIWRLFIYKKRLINEFRPDVIIASSTYPLDIYPAHRIARSVNAKLIFEVHDLWPLSPMELGGMSRWHPFIMVMQKAEDYAYKVSDYVVSLLPKAYVYMQEHGMAPHKFVYIPNGINVEEWSSCNSSPPKQHLEIIRNIKKQGYFLVGYTGAHGVANALDHLIDAALLLQNEPVFIILVGKGSEKEKLQQKALKLGLKNVMFLPPVPRSAIPELLSLFDALYIGLKRQSLFRFGISPNKLIDYMMAGKPIIHAIEAGNDMVSEAGCGISIPPEDPKAIVDAIKKLMNMSSIDRNQMGSRCREYVLLNHDYRILAKRFLEVMKK